MTDPKQRLNSDSHNGDKRFPSGLNNQGNSLIEIVIVLVILGILALVAVSSFAGVSDAALKSGEPRKVIAHLRYVQARAMSDQSARYYLSFNGSTYCMKKYELESGGSVTDLVLPGQNDSSVSLDGGITITAANFGFNSEGQPLTGNNPAAMFKFNRLELPSLTLNGAGATIKVNHHGYIYL